MTIREAKELYLNHEMVQHIECGRIAGEISCFDDDKTGVYIKPHYTFTPLSELQKFDVHKFYVDC